MDALPLPARKLRAKGSYQQQSAVASLAQRFLGVTYGSLTKIADSPLFTGGYPPVTTSFRYANAVTGDRNRHDVGLITTVIKTTERHHENDPNRHQLGTLCAERNRSDGALDNHGYQKHVKYFY